MLLPPFSNGSVSIESARTITSVIDQALQASLPIQDAKEKLSTIVSQVQAQSDMEAGRKTITEMDSAELLEDDCVDIKSRLLYLPIISGTQECYTFNALCKLPRAKLNNLATSYLSLPTVNGITKEQQVKRMLRTSKARVAEPESVARAELLGQTRDATNCWVRRESAVRKFEFSDGKMSYNKKKEISRERVSQTSES